MILLLPLALYDFFHRFGVGRIKIERNDPVTELLINLGSVTGGIVIEAEFFLNVVRSFGQFLHVVNKERTTCQKFTRHSRNPFDH